MVLARMRWQIELLFKRWKSQLQLDVSRSHPPWRILCEIDAKLLVALFAHWLLALTCWEYPDRSLPKALRTIQAHAAHLATRASSTTSRRWSASSSGCSAGWRTAVASPNANNARLLTNDCLP